MVSNLIRRRVVWSACAVLFFVLYSFVAFQSPTGMFNSPDEAANHYFATVVAKGQAPQVAEPFEGVGNGYVHPRSMTVVEGKLVPGSFHGLPVLYGIIAAALGSWVIVYLTPLIAVFAVFAWRRTVTIAFGSRAGTIATLLLAILPAWWYYANRALYHNVLFTSLLVFAAYFFIAKPFEAIIRKERLRTTYYVLRTLDPILAGVALGLALWVRTAEVVWVGLAVVALFICMRKLLRMREVLLFFFAAFFAFLPALALNQQLYDHPFGTGYSATTNQVSIFSGGAALVGSGGAAQASDFTPYDIVKKTLLPFGFHPRIALTHFNRYFISLPWWMSVATLLGLVWLVYEWGARGRRNRKEVLLILAFFGVTGWLAVVYGSWVVHDNPDPTAVTIGISYSRYWLPAFVLGTAVAGVGLAHLSRHIRRGLLIPISIFYLLFSIFLSFNTVFFTKGDGLRDINHTLAGYALVREDVDRRIEEDAVIVVDRADKLFFPGHHVITPLRRDEHYATLPALLARTSVYYYGITLASDDERFHNEEKLPPLGVRLVPVVTYDDHTLYQFILNP